MTCRLQYSSLLHTSCSFVQISVMIWSHSVDERPVLFWDGLDSACDEVLRDQKKLDGPRMGKMRRSRGFRTYAGSHVDRNK